MKNFLRCLCCTATVEKSKADEDKGKRVITTVGNNTVHIPLDLNRDICCKATMETLKVDDDRDKQVITTVGNNGVQIPLDLTIEILTRLPAKSLFKFRCVSKQWCSIIRSRSFTDSFMSQSLCRPYFLFISQIGYNKSGRLRFFSSPLPPRGSGSNHSSLIIASKYEMPLSIIYPSIYIGPSCNSVRGIICFPYGHCGYLLWNPTTRQVKSIPNDSAGSNTMCRMHLGYNPSINQYKILRMSYSSSGQQHNVCTLNRGVHLSSFSSWRRLESNILYQICHTNEVCIDGFLYYKALKDQWTGNLIVSFDVGSERLLVIEAPKEDEMMFSLLINYQGKLAIFSVDNKTNSYILWVLDNVKEQIWSSNTGIFAPSFGCSYRDLKLRACSTTDAGEIVFRSELIWNGFDLFYYDLKKNVVTRRVRVGGIRDNDKFTSFFFVSCDHVENLTPL